MASPLSEREAAFQGWIMDLAARLGWKAWHVPAPMVYRGGRFVGAKQGAGIPDLLLVRERVVFAEVKGGGGEVTEKQRECLDALRAAGAEAYLWFPGDRDEVEAVLKRRAA